jgi:hypothetical protein
LTVAEIEKQEFAIAVVPHTARSTTLGMRKVGDAVNLEVGGLRFRYPWIISGGSSPELDRQTSPRIIGKDWRLDLPLPAQV